VRQGEVDGLAEQGLGGRTREKLREAGYIDPIQELVRRVP